jgi:hypothetical protein
MTTLLPNLESTPSRDRLALRSPALTNLSGAQWSRYEQTAYLFARHSRHDLANIHCALGLYEVIEEAHQGKPEAELPEDLRPARLKQRLYADIKRSMTMSYDLILLSQAANPVAYREVRSESPAAVLRAAVLDRVVDEPSGLAQGMEQVENESLILMGDTLPAAIAVFFFQWTDRLGHPLPTEVKVSITSENTGRALVLNIPATGGEDVHLFLKALTQGESSLEKTLEEDISITTTELALWLAEAIVRVHGGSVSSEGTGSTAALRVCLPLVR